MKGRLLAAAAALVAAGVGAWLLSDAGRGGGADRAGGGGMARPAAPRDGEAPLEGPAARAESRGAIEGVVLGGGKPAAATVTAWLLNRGPADPDSWEVWQRHWDRPDLLAGIDPVPRGEVVTGPDGRWSLRGLGAGEFHFEARAADGWKGHAGASLCRDGSPALEPGKRAEPVEIELHPWNCTLRGRASNLDGSPFDGFVLARWDDDLFLPARTDSDGRFALERLPAATVRLSALVPGVREVPGPAVILPKDGEVSFTVGSGMEEVEGRVLEDATGNPVEGAAVVLRQDRWSDFAAAEVLRSGGDGRFALKFITGGWVRILVEAPGFVPLEDSFEDQGSAFRRPVTLRLRRPAALSGRVLTPEGAPAAGAEVVVLPDTQVPGVPSRGRRAVAAADGRYKMEGVASGEAVVLVAGGGFVSRSLVGPAPWNRREDTVALAEGRPAARDVVAVPCARARGRVLDAEGRALAGARVRVEQEDLGGIPDEAGGAGEIEAGSDGTFSLSYLLPGFAAGLTAEESGRPRAVGEIPPLAPGAEGEVLLRAAPERTLEVRVVEAGTGRPLAGIGVDVEAGFFPDQDGSLDVDGDWITGEDGVARVGPVPAVPLELQPFGRDPWWFGTEFEVGAAEVGPVTLEVDPLEMPGSLAIEGRVLFPDGAPAVGAVVECGTAGQWACMGFTGDSVPTDPEGRFRVTSLHPKEYEVRASLDRWGRRFDGRVEVAGGARGVVVRLEDESLAAAGLDGEDGKSRFRVRVLGSSGKPVASGDVSIEFLGNEGDRDGVSLFLRDGLCAAPLPDWPGGGRAWVEVTRAMETGDPDSCLAHAVFGPFPARAGEVEVSLPPGLTIEGSVVDPEGRGIPRAKVNLYSGGAIEGPHGETLGGGRIADAVADAEGRFRVEGAGDRPYVLVAGAPTSWCDSEKVPARGGAKDVTLVLRPAVAVLVAVEDPEGRPVPHVRVWALQGYAYGTRHPSGWTNAAGLARLEGLDPERTATLGVGPPEDREDLLPEERREWSPADTTVRLRGGYALEVLVQDAEGRPVEEAVVRCSGEGSKLRGRRETTNAEGTARFVRLAPGRYVLRARLSEDDADDTLTEGVAVDAAAGRATLVVDTGLELRILLREAGKPAEDGKAYLARAGGEEVSRSAGASASGEVRLRGLRADAVYDVHCSGDEGRSGAVLRGVRAGGRPLEVDLAPGRTITGRVLLPPGGRLDGIAVLVGKAPMFRAEYDRDDGTFLLPGVPEGRWILRAEVVVGEASTFVEVEAEAGAEVEIDARRK